MPDSVTLGGLHVDADDPVVWEFRTGTQPVWKTFTCTPAEAKALLYARGPLTLEIKEAGKPDRRIEHLWVLFEEAGPNPYVARVRVFDRRWFWQYGHILRRYNMRRKNGFFRIVAEDVEELERVSDEFQFLPPTVIVGDGGQVVRWEPLQMLRDVATRAVEIEARQAIAGGIIGSPAPVVFDFPEGTVPSVPVVDLAIDDRADTAVMRAMQQVPALAVTVDADGAVVFFDRTDGRERDLLPENLGGPLGPEMEDGGHVIMADHANEAPSEIHLLATISAEVRLTFDAAMQRAGIIDERGRYLYNVIRNPLYQFDVAGVALPQGTPIDTHTFLAWLPEVPYGGELTDRHIREGMIPESDFFSRVLEVGALTVDYDWASVVDGFLADFYQTFRVARVWHDSVLEWRDHRVTTVNNANGEPGPAMAWGGYFRKGSERSKFRDYAESNDADGDKMHYGFNVNGYRDVLDASARPVPADVRFVDSARGLLRLDFKRDKWNVFTTTLPAQIETDKLPAFHAPGVTTAPISFNSVKQVGDSLPALDDQHKVSVIVTAVPAAPNDARQLYRIVIRPGDLSPNVSPAIRSIAERARGPIKEIRLPPDVELARLRWLDSRAGDIENLFGVGDVYSRIAAAAGGDASIPEPNLEGLCVNATTNIGPPGNGGAHLGAPLDELAHAAAERMWATYVDHPQGQFASDAFATADWPKIRGWLESLYVTVQPTGDTTLTARFPERLEEVDWRASLPRDVQSRILREVPL